MKPAARQRRPSSRKERSSKTGTPNVAVVGSGYWGRNLIRNFHQLGALRAICDADEETLRDTAAGYAGVRIGSSFDTLLEDPGLTAVALATPARTHAAMTRQALLAGKDVFVEKPLALSPAEGRELVDLARSKGRVLMVGHLLWYHPAVLRLKELVDSGELGRLQYVYSNRLNLGRFRREENILWSFAPHDVSVILGLIGEAPDRIQAQGGYYLHQKIADVTVTTLGFPSGARAHVFVSWLHPYKEQRLVVVGDRKMALFDDLAEEKLKLYPHTIEWQENFPVPRQMSYEPMPLDDTEPLRNECLHFLECVKTRSTPRTDAAEGLRVLDVLDRCQTALEREGASTTTPAMPTEGNRLVHPTAEVEDGARLGEGSRVWHHAHVMPGARIGRRCSLGQNVFVGKGVRIGDDVKIQNNVSVYEGVTLEDGVFCGPSMVFTNVFNPRSEIERKDEYRTTLVRRGATFGANSTILCGITVGTYAFVGAGAVVTRNVPDYALVVGNPARQTGWMCVCGLRLPGKRREPSCETCGRRYRQVEDRLEPSATNS